VCSNLKTQILMKYVVTSLALSAHKYSARGALICAAPCPRETRNGTGTIAAAIGQPPHDPGIAVTEWQFILLEQGSTKVSTLI
jgi:hypothetical protein